jgi:glycosyltransferase involved in cell wall biosynthesis
MKISILSTSDFPRHGAPESFVRMMALGLAANGITVEVVRFWGGRYSKINDTQIKRSNYLFRSPFRNCALKLFEVMSQIAYIPFFIWSRKFKYHDTAIILYGLDRCYFAFPFSIFCRVLNLKCIRVITEVYFSNESVLGVGDSIRCWLDSMQLKYFDRYFDGLLVLSKYLHDLSRSNLVIEKKLLLLPHFINLGVAENNLRADNIFRIGYCGAITKNNGIFDLLKAFSEFLKSVEDSELYIMGEVSPDVYDVFVREGLLDERVVFTGQLDTFDLEVSLRSCDVLVNPRQVGVLADSGFPTKIGEYFSTKIPVISTEVGEIVRYFTDKQELIYAAPGNSDSLAKALLFVYENEAAACVIGQRGYEWACDNLDYKRNAQKLIKFIYGI